MITRLARHSLVLADSTRMLGVAGALRAHSRNFAGKRAAAPAPTALRVRGVRHPIHYRAGTSDWPVLQKIFMEEEYAIGSPEHARAVQAHHDGLIDAGRRPVIVDCGANIGLASVWYATRYPDAAIVAIEPEADNFALLQTNCAPYPNITAIRAAVSDREGSVSLANGSGESWAWETIESADGDTATVTVPEVLSAQTNGTPFLVKIDIEGFEVELFRSNTDWVQQTPVLVFETHDGMFPWRGTAQAMLSVLGETPRDYLIRGENMFAISTALAR